MKYVNNICKKCNTKENFLYLDTKQANFICEKCDNIF